MLLDGPALLYGDASHIGERGGRHDLIIVVLFPTLELSFWLPVREHLLPFLLQYMYKYMLDNDFIKSDDII